MSINPESLEFHIERYLQSPRSANLQSNFLLRLQLTTDEKLLIQLYGKYPTRPELAVPICRRLVELKPNNTDYLVSLGFALFTVGMDSEAREIVDQVLLINPNCIDGLQLQAAIATTIEEKRTAFAKILNLEPGNKEAFQQLVMLRFLEDGTL